MQTSAAFDRAPARKSRTPADALPEDAGASVLFFDEPPVRPKSLRPQNRALAPLLAQLLNAESGLRRREIVDSVVRDMGFDGLIYGRITITRGGPIPTAVCVAHGDANRARRYFARRHHTADPLLQAALRSTLPCMWNVDSLLRTATSDRKCESLRKLLDAMCEAGMRSGVMFTMPGPRTDERSIVSLSSNTGNHWADGDALAARIVLLATCLHEFYSRYTQWPQDASMRAPKLSGTQDQILHCLAHGLTDREIAEALSLSTHGVDYHMRQLRQCFNARNRVELVQAAFRAGSL
jgi:DNA-binding CsgD family transcriptional regulator